MRSIAFPVLDQTLTNAAKDGRIVLFLGAGASMGSVNAKGDQIPNGKQLGALIAQRLLRKEHEEMDFKSICDFACSSSSVRDVQRFIYETLEGFQPTAMHRRLPDFVWAGLATTNYDLLVERAYAQNTERLQNLLVYSRNGSSVLHRRGKDDVIYAKLHGCLTEYDDIQVPLVATTEQILRSTSGRSNLFKQFLEWGQTQTLVFIGYGMMDGNLRSLTDTLVQEGDARRRHYLVKPWFDDIESRYWIERRIQPLATDFAGFIAALDAAVPTATRTLAKVAVSFAQTSISRFISLAGVSESSELKRYLSSGFEHVGSHIAGTTGNASRFYSGFDEGWYPIEHKLDVQRPTNEILLTRCVIPPEAPNTQIFYLLKAHAGAGKTIALRRVAWEAANTYQRLAFFVQSGTELDFDLIEEIVRLTNKTVYLFLDDAGERVDAIRALLRIATRKQWSLIVIGAERTNEWNYQGEEADRLVDDEFTLPYLTLNEIIDLVDLLDKNDSLGELANLSQEERVDRFSEYAGRQLLVALHEATHGQPFEKILQNEYENIFPPEARLLYLDICALHRLGSPVRAGLISRIHGITFEDFGGQFLQPLKGVVAIAKDPKTQDYVYRARHSYIADIVFENVLSDRKDRFDLLMRIIGKLNTDYSYDQGVLFQLLRAKTIAEWFPDPFLGRELYDAAERAAGRSAGLWQQRGIYEMRVAGDKGGLEYADRCLQEAKALDPQSRALKHSLAELALKRSELATTPIEAAALRQEAARIASSLTTGSYNSYPFHTLVKIARADLDDALRTEERAPSELTTAAVTEAIQRAEQALRNGSSKFPNDPYLLSEEAELAKQLKNAVRAQKALEKAFRQNSKSELIANRLALIYASQDLPNEALDVLRRGLENNPGSRLLHYRYAQALLRVRPDADTSDADTMKYHLQRSFSPGDTNYEAQFWYARQLCLMGAEAEAKPMFEAVAKLKLPFLIRNAIEGHVKEADGQLRVFSGEVLFVNANGGYGFIQQNSPALRAFFSNRENAAALRKGDRVRFNLGFTIRGPIATGINRQT